MRLLLFFSACMTLLCSCASLVIQTPLMKSDAIILLAGNHKERAPAAAMLYRDGYAPRILLTNDGIFSSWSTKYNRNLYQVEWAEEELVNLGVPREHIIKLPYYGSATVYDALAVKRYLFKSGLKKIIVVTSDYHTRRAFWTFKHVLKSYTNDIAVYPAKSFGLSLKQRVLEYAKLAGYKIKYGLLGLIPEANEVALTTGQSGKVTTPVMVFDLIIFAYLFVTVIVLVWSVRSFCRRKTLGKMLLVSIALLTLGGLLLIDMLIIEPNWIAVERVDVSDTELAQVFSGVTVVQISDLHVRNKLGYRENSLVEKVNALNPDIILITGDILEHIEELPAAKSILKRLKARHGTFAVLGNTDHSLGQLKMDRLVDELGKEGVVFLRNNNISVPLQNGRALRLAGVDDPVSNRAHLNKALADIPEGEPVLLLAHSPSVYTQAILAGVNLVLVGHTHGGQVGIPWLIRQSEYANRSSVMSGIVRDGKTTMYVNRGIGTKTLPIRLFCRPEITAFTFK